MIGQFVYCSRLTALRFSVYHELNVSFSRQMEGLKLPMETTWQSFSMTMIFTAMFLRRFRRTMTILRLNRSDRNGIISRERWTAREYVESLNRTLTKVSPSIFSENRLYTLHHVLPLSLSLPLACFLSQPFFSLSLSFTPTRARPTTEPAGG